MAGRGPNPKDPDARRRRNAPARGEWAAKPGAGWQHGPIPPCPAGVLAATQTAWKTWFRAWYAAHWGPEALPQLRQLARLFDAVERGDFVRATELRLWQDTWGITPKGQQDRHWAPPKADDKPKAADADPGPDGKPAGRYGHLRSVAGGQA